MKLRERITRPILIAILEFVLIIALVISNYNFYRVSVTTAGSEETNSNPSSGNSSGRSSEDERTSELESLLEQSIVTTEDNIVSGIKDFLRAYFTIDSESFCSDRHYDSYKEYLTERAQKQLEPLNYGSGQTSDNGNITYRSGVVKMDIYHTVTGDGTAQVFVIAMLTTQVNGGLRNDTYHALVLDMTYTGGKWLVDNFIVDAQIDNTDLPNAF